MKEQTPTHAIRPCSWAVLLIDMQEYFTKFLSDKCLDRILEGQLKTIEECRIYEVPLVAIRFKDCGDFIPPIAKALKEVPHLSLEKSCNSAFQGGTLSKLLSGLSTKDLMLCGIYAGACVSSTALSAVHKGYRIHTGYPWIAESDSNGDIFDIMRPWYKLKGSFYEDFVSLETLMKE